MDIDGSHKRPVLYYGGICALSGMLSLMVLITSTMYHVSSKWAGHPSYDTDGIFEIDANETTWSKICGLSAEESNSGTCLQYKLRFMVGILGILVGLVQLIVSSICALTFYHPYRLTKKFYCFILLCSHIFFLAVVSMMLVMVVTMAHSNYETELVRPESYSVVVGVFGLENAFLLLAIVSFACLLRKLEVEEPAEED